MIAGINSPVWHILRVSPVVRGPSPRLNSTLAQLTPPDQTFPETISLQSSCLPLPSHRGITQYLLLIPSAGSTAHCLCITKGWQKDVWHSVCCALQHPVYYYNHRYCLDSLSDISSATVCRYPKPQAYTYIGMSLKLGLFPSGSSRRVGCFHGGCFSPDRPVFGLPEFSEWWVLGPYPLRGSQYHCTQTLGMYVWRRCGRVE